jgi:vancomycin resistance protein YoaR
MKKSKEKILLRIKKKESNKTVNKKFIIFILFLLFVFGVFCFIYENKYINKIYPGVYIGEINIGGKTLLEAEGLINIELDNLSQEGITFIFENNKSIIHPIVSSSDASVLDVLVSFDVEDTLKRAFFVGRNQNFINNTFNKIKLFLNKKNHIGLTVDFNNEKIISYLKEDFSLFDYRNACYYFDNSNNLLIKAGKGGKKIDYDNSLVVLKNNIKKLNFSDILLEGEYVNPEISENDCFKSKDKIEDVLNLAPVKLRYLKRYWNITKQEFLEMILLSKEDDTLVIGLDKDNIREFIKKNIAVDIDQISSLPKFVFDGNIVKNFEPGQEGKKLDIDLTVEILSNLIENPFNELILTVNTLPFPKNIDENLNGYGIREIIGKYSLGFEGSTTARTLNIKNGTKSLNGLLIKPGEEFSTLKALGDIDEEHGYEKEAVIKGDSIHYEFGGGLCHISTTLFRTILESGLPITMRQNHSYDMPYYKPAGTDATIYNPLPDFKFINDTGNYILIQAKLIGQELYIEIWGAKDGRIIEKKEPVIYNIVKPLPIKYIKTYTLSSGKIKCTYAPYDGADAYFDYIVTYSDGTIKEKRFKSHYIPRQGICLIGI